LAELPPESGVTLAGAPTAKFAEAVFGEDGGRKEVSS
jgi:hypothetical protein